MQRFYDIYFSDRTDQRTFTDLIWHKNKAPVVLIKGINNLDDLTQRLKTQTQSQSKLKLTIRRPNVSEIWKIINIVIVPILWVLVLASLIIEIIVHEQQQEEYFTLILLCLNCVTFILPAMFVFFRKKQDILDEQDQFYLIRSILEFDEKENLEDILDDYFFMKDQRLYWKKFHTNWDISIFYPNYTVLDIIGAFVGFYSIMYLFSWIGFTLGASDIGELNQIEQRQVIYFVLLLTIVFLIYFMAGLYYGYKSSWEMRWDELIAKKLIFILFFVLFLSMIGVIILSLRFEMPYQLAFLFILIFEVPLITSFVINRIRLLIELSNLKVALVQVITHAGFRLGERLKKSSINSEQNVAFDYLVNENHARSYLSKSVISATKVRSYLLIATGILSLITSILTAFISSSSLFTEIVLNIFR